MGPPNPPKTSKAYSNECEPFLFLASGIGFCCYVDYFIRRPMKTKLITIFALSLLLGTSAAYAKGTSCKSFSNQSAAQDYYNAKKKGWKGLDRDKDGEACECLPGGSKYEESVCRSWRKKNGK